MKKLCVLLLIGLSACLVGCKKETPSSGSGTEPAPMVSPETQKALKETAEKAVEAAKPVLQDVKQALVAKAAEIDLTSSLDTLKEQAKQMSVDALKETAEKYKAQFLTTQTDWTAKTEALTKIPMTEKLGAEAQALTKDITTLTNTMASLKDRMMVYVNALKAQGIDVSNYIKF
jgi:hypothetical protein